MTSELVHLAGRVWLCPHDPDPDNVQGGIGVVADERGSVVVDAGNSPFLARRVRDAMVGATVADSGIRFLGDCFYPPPFDLRRDGDTHDLAMLRRLLRDDIEWYVDAHSAPVRAGDLAATADD